jgi:hypothetical protein
MDSAIVYGWCADLEVEGKLQDLKLQREVPVEFPLRFYRRRYENHHFPARRYLKKKNLVQTLYLLKAKLAFLGVH